MTFSQTGRRRLTFVHYLKIFTPRFRPRRQLYTWSKITAPSELLVPTQKYIMWCGRLQGVEVFFAFRACRSASAFCFGLRASRGFAGSQQVGGQEAVDESAGATSRGLLDDEELGRMAVRMHSSHVQFTFAARARTRHTFLLVSPHKNTHGMT